MLGSTLDGELGYLDVVTLGDLLRQRIQERQITNQQAADEMDVTATTLSRWLNDKDRPHPRRIDGIAKWLGRPIPDVLSAVYASDRVAAEVPVEVIELLTELTAEVKQLRAELSELAEQRSPTR